MGLLEVLLILFIVLKLTGLVAWSWWWVLSPLLAIGFLGLFAVYVLWRAAR